jgi:FkbM family methyltransferase
MEMDADPIQGEDDAPVAKAIDLGKARAALEGGASYLFHDLKIATCVIDGKPVNFATDMKRDPIQRANRNGVFYEPEELELIRQHFPAGGVFVDIGANVGNHSLFVGRFLAPSKVIPFEPNPLAYRLLLVNVAINGLTGVFDLSHIGMGLSDKEQAGFAMTERQKNLGAARMVEGAGDIAVIRGDDALAGIVPDFIKIDVEGMEMMVLAGLGETIGKSRPKILIEVDNKNAADFFEWVDAAGYAVAETIERYPVNKNHFLIPRET